MQRLAFDFYETKHFNKHKKLTEYNHDLYEQHVNCHCQNQHHHRAHQAQRGDAHAPRDGHNYDHDSHDYHADHE